MKSRSGSRGGTAVVADGGHSNRPPTAGVARGVGDALVGALPVAIVLTQLDGKIASLNAAAERLLGYASAEAVGRPLALIIASDWAPEVRAVHDRALLGETVEGFTAQCLAKGGRQLRVRLSLANRLDHGGLPEGVALVLVPAEPSRPPRPPGSGDRLRVELGSVRIGTWQWHLGTGQMAWSPTLEELHGLAPGGFGGSVQDFERFVHPDDRSKLFEDMQRAVQGASSFQREYRFVKPDGSIGWLEASARILLDAHGRPERLSTVCVDITVQKQAELLLQSTRGEVHRLGNEVERRLEEAERANRAKDQVLAVLAHELRGPLAPALSAAELLAKHDALPEDLRQDVLTIERSLRLAARMVGDLLDLSRISRHKVDLVLERVDIASVVDDALALCMADLERAGLGLAVHGERGAAWVHGDAARLSQVLWNLLTNAIKFTPARGAIRVAWRRNDSHIELEVSDTGCGIPPELLPRVFEPFEQGLVDERQGRGGLGLGLAISRALVEMHGGSIEVESQGNGYGATFRIALPAARSPTSEAAAAAVRAASLSVLVVEDHRDLARMLAELLALLGHRAVTAGSVDEAIACCERQRFDILLSDIELGPKLGYELVRYLRETGVDTPAIALSGRSGKEAIQRSLEAGFLDHLVKPVGARALLEAIARIAETTSKRS